MSEEHKSGVVNKTFTIIKSFVDVQPEWGVRDLAKHLGFPPSTLHRFLLQLQEEGILEYNPLTNKYRIGIEMVRISSIVASNVDVIKIARPYMEKLVQMHNEAICLVLYHNKLRKIVFVDRIYGPDPLQYVIALGEFQPVPYGSSGKSILAFLDPQETEQIYQQEQLSSAEIVRVNEELAAIRERGFASTHGERIAGSKGIAAPIFNSSGQPIASLIYTVPVTRFQPSEEQKISVNIKRMTLKISKILGYRKSEE